MLKIFDNLTEMKAAIAKDLVAEWKMDGSYEEMDGCEIGMARSMIHYNPTLGWYCEDPECYAPVNDKQRERIEKL